ncbi:Amino acid permease [Aphelenchoides bicaudatus]|nr:Amino acid permease [Aphelenchoides bicaudatus]
MSDHKQLDANLKLTADSDPKDALIPQKEGEEKKPLDDVSNEAVLVELEEEAGLRKTLGLWNGVSIIVGSIIGSGIFIAPTGVQIEAGSVGISLLVWLISGIFAALGAWSYAELGTLIRKSGGDYAYIHEAFGPFIAFIRFWIEAIVVRPVSALIVALTFATYMLKPFYPDSELPPYSTEILAVGLIVFLTAINCASVRLSTLIQDTFTIAKVFALIMIILTGGFFLIRGREENLASFQNIWANSTTDPGKISLAFYSGLFAYQGWNYLNFIVEELQNPKRDLPLAIIISCVSVTIIYVLTNVALYTVISPAEMITSKAVALDFANRVYGPLAFLMPVFIACSTLGSANGVIFTSSRLFYVGAREGQMPEVLTMVNHKTATPIPAVLVTGLLSLAYLGLSSNVYSLINYIQISYWLAIAFAIASLFYFRIKMPDATRPIKVFLGTPIIFFIGCLFLVFVPIVGNPLETTIGLGIMFTAIPIYLIFIKWQPKILTSMSAAMTKFLQKWLGVSAVEKK